ncbi:DUF7524 family protein [Natrinema altunense]|uniref:Uncharacterized protein n=1 Tax=Natrinema altunense (strain JCM 12890 / CGMCC 1.3731 / AJ2) TaxID=1227494 RepID=L9ZVN8_NATA2|nr:hypothetical protein [Natrinema altunense]ELY89662.1 hypothetical protein C485_04170 [Natrinema altunense JCM 12890]
MSGTEVAVHVNRGAAEALEATSGTLETSASFSVLLYGHETPAHVHCRLDGDLERIASLGESNYYVEPETVTRVPVTVVADAIDRPVDGRLEVLTGYGSESVSIAVTVEPGPPGVDVDESLAEPTRSEPEPTAFDRAVDRCSAVTAVEPATLVVLALGAVAVGVAGVTTATIGGPVATAGLGIVGGGVLVALFLLLQ